MYVPEYIDLKAARLVLQEIGVELNERQMKRAAEMDGSGHRKLPFFKGPIDGRKWHVQICTVSWAGTFWINPKAVESHDMIDPDSASQLHAKPNCVAEGL